MQGGKLRPLDRSNPTPGNFRERHRYPIAALWLNGSTRVPVVALRSHVQMSRGMGCRRKAAVGPHDRALTYGRGSDLREKRSQCSSRMTEVSKNPRGFRRVRL